MEYRDDDGSFYDERPILDIRIHCGSLRDQRIDNRAERDTFVGYLSNNHDIHNDVSTLQHVRNVSSVVTKIQTIAWEQPLIKEPCALVIPYLHPKASTPLRQPWLLNQSYDKSRSISLSQNIAQCKSLLSRDVIVFDARMAKRNRHLLCKQAGTHS